MITSHIMGGLGNQLFQIFATIAYSIQHNKPFIFPYQTRLDEKRHAYWDTFLDTLKTFTTETSLNYYETYGENGFIYNELPYSEKPMKLHGYFQSHKYFENEFYTICSLIQFKKKQETVRKEYRYLFPPDKHMISIHFRRGDYKNVQQCHNILSNEYYIQGLNYIMKENTRVLFFCEKEDNEEIYPLIAQFKQIFPRVEFIKVDDTIEDWKQMILMSCCHDNIIANSSFSWWGAYFNDYPKKRVIYPSQWFGPVLSHNNTRDLCPAEWIKVLT